ncbi:hypothetical protein RJ641_003241 [Dillenia turbinata]|uniref:Uncharacterized protein n=1 Tax=Dillenia turbinata TaxID=194707 RepID=A0AAN8VAN2_9MAGN
MVRPMPLSAGGGDQFCSVPLAIGLFISVSALVALCAKHGNRVLRKQNSADSTDSKVPIKSPSTSSKQLLQTISSKAIRFLNKKHNGEELEPEGGAKDEAGLWQKSILMGEKCQPLEFSGVIYYDCYGNILSEPPLRSPRASPLHHFALAAAKDANNSS